MVRFSIKDVQAGMVLGRSILQPNGQLLLAAGYKMDSPLITRLKSMSYHYVYIQEEGTENVSPEEIITEHTQQEMGASYSKLTEDSQKLFKIREYSKKAVEDCIKAEQKNFNQIVSNPRMEAVVVDVIDQILAEPALLLNISALKSKEDYLFQHAINVTITSLCLGKEFNFTKEELKQLGFGAICYDIGMMAIPKEILEKPGELTTEEALTVREHTSYGFLLLSKNPKMPATSSIIALQHHEKQDGTGYPAGLTGSNSAPVKTLMPGKSIHRFAEIVAVADTYDSIISNRPHSGPKFPLSGAIRELIKNAGTQLNKEIVKKLISIVPVFPVGTKIRVVSTPVKDLIGYQGVVARVDKENILKPEIVLYKTSAGIKINPIQINLAEKSIIKIEPII